MLYLASSSASRARVLKEAGIDFVQLEVAYNENKTAKLQARILVQNIVLEKEKEFFAKFTNYEKTLQSSLTKDIFLFADSIVCVNEKIFTKAKNDKEAYEMLKLQSANSASILSAMILNARDKRVFSLSKTILFFDKFEEKDMKEYIQKGLYQGKAGAIMCEGFHKKYIKKMKGHISTALGLDIPTLKAYL